MLNNKPILALDFDGVIHSYTSGWHGADVVPDPPVPGAMRFIWDATEHFRVAIYSSRSHAPGGKRAMQNWLAMHFRDHWAADRTTCDDKLAEIEWPDAKPPAMLTIDDRALPFTGEWPPVEALLEFKPWNRPGAKKQLTISELLLSEHYVREIDRMRFAIAAHREAKCWEGGEGDAADQKLWGIIDGDGN